MAETETETTPREKIAAWMEAHGVTVEADFVPYSQSRNAKPRPGQDKPWPSLNWRVRLMRGGRQILATDYSAGSGHAPGHKAGKLAWVHSGLSESVARAELVAFELEHGFPGCCMAGGVVRASRAAPIMPDPCDVLCSLASDSDAIDAGGFEQWASEFGYDTDSRAAEATYRACLEIALKLRAGLGEAALTALRDACQDY